MIDERTNKILARAAISAALEEVQDVRKTARADFEADADAGLFDHNKAAQWVEQCRQTKPHRFYNAGNDPLADKAWRDGNVTAAAQFIRDNGTEAAQAAATARGNTLIPRGAGKSADPPDGEQLKGGAGSDNPWLNTPRNVLPNGRYSPDAFTRQSEKARVPAVAHDLAARAGSFVGATVAPGARKRA